MTVIGPRWSRQEGGGGGWGRWWWVRRPRHRWRVIVWADLGMVVVVISVEIGGGGWATRFVGDNVWLKAYEAISRN